MQVYIDIHVHRERHMYTQRLKDVRPTCTQRWACVQRNVHEYMALDAFTKGQIHTQKCTETLMYLVLQAQTLKWACVPKETA